MSEFPPVFGSVPAPAENHILPKRPDNVPSALPDCVRDCRCPTKPDVRKRRTSAAILWQRVWYRRDIRRETGIVAMGDDMDKGMLDRVKVGGGDSNGAFLGKIRKMDSCSSKV